MIAEDEPNILSLLKLMFKDKYNIITAQDGEEALFHIRKRKPHLVLLDVLMPKLNGYEVCEILKKDEKTRGITIAMLSAKGQERDIIQGLNIGADHYITKPFDPMLLERKVKEMIEGDQEHAKKN